MSKQKHKRSGPKPNLSPWQVEKLIDKAKTDASNEATSLALVLMFTVLLDKYNAADYIKDIYNDWNKLAEEVIEKRVKLHELRDVLRREYEIQI